MLALEIAKHFRIWHFKIFSEDFNNYVKKFVFTAL